MNILTSPRRTVATLVVGAVALVGMASMAAAQVDNDQNEPEYWEQRFADDGYENVSCSKTEGFRDGDTEYEMPAAPEGEEWIALIIKSGSGDDANFVVMDPVVGETYGHPTDKDISHVITCTGTMPEDEPSEDPTEPSEEPSDEPSEEPEDEAPGPEVETDIPGGSSNTGLLALGALGLVGLAGLGLRAAAQRD